jgi:thiol:disulfide interchange protein DsbD
LFSIITKAQVYNPVKWKTSVEKISDTDYNLVTKATIENGWHLYSQNVPEDGPNPTVFTFSKTSDYQLAGNVIEDKGKTVNDVVFKMQIKFFENQATFKQRIKVIGTKPFQVKGELEFMACNDESCLPPMYEDLLFTITPVVTLAPKEAAPKSTAEIIATPTAVASIVVKIDTVVPVKKEVVSTTIKSNTSAEKGASKSLWSIFILSFLSGFAADLPMQLSIYSVRIISVAFPFLVLSAIGSFRCISAYPG